MKRHLIIERRCLLQNFNNASFTANGKVTFNQVSNDGVYLTFGVENSGNSVAVFNNDLEVNINTPGSLAGVKFDEGTVSLNGATTTFHDEYRFTVFP